ncbi:MAG: rhodanese-like domain-containing protein [Brachymonas sp.]|nr:rhodanese-like domain-containing protein [Brachymonas sp.]
MQAFFRTTLIAAALALPVAAQATQSVASKTGALPSKPVAKARGLWIDVRTPEEFRSGHLQGAINIPVQNIRSAIMAVSPDKNAPLHLYCRSGRRVEVALQELKALGYTNITNHGGYEDLLRRGIQ